MAIIKSRILQNNFTGGELSPLLRSRTDLNKYASSVQALTNFIPLPQGPVRFRNGFSFCGTARGVSRLVPFIFNTQQNYILEFGNEYIRVYKNGGLVTYTPLTIIDITKAKPAVVTYTGDDSGLSDGDYVLVDGVVNMLQVNNRQFVIADLNTSTKTFSLSGIDSTYYSTYYSGGTAAKIFEVVTPYQEADLFDLDVDTQSGDVLYIFHYSYSSRKLLRLADKTWQLAEISFKHPPTYEKDTSVSFFKEITSLTHVTTTATLTLVAHGYQEGNFIEVVGCEPDVYNGVFKIASVPTADTLTFTLSYDPGMDSTGTDRKVSGSVLWFQEKTGDDLLVVAGERLFYDGDIGRSIVVGDARATIKETHVVADQSKVKTLESLTRSGTTATATLTGHGYNTNNWVNIVGAKQDAYNGTWKITVSTADIFTYTLDTKDVRKTATGTISCYKTLKAKNIDSFVCTGTEVVVTTASAHTFTDDDLVRIKGAVESGYNGKWYIYDVTSTTFSFSVEVNLPSENPTGTPKPKVSLLSPTNTVLVDIRGEFLNKKQAASDWYLKSSPNTILTFRDTRDNRLAHGELITITAKDKCFRSNDVGKYIKFQRGTTGTYASYAITKYIDSRKIKAEIKKRMHMDDYPVDNEEYPEVQGGDWTLETERWGESSGYPAVSTFFQDRLWLCRDDYLWASVVGDYEKFLIGADDDEAIEFALGSRQVDLIKWIIARDYLFVGTSGGEWKITPPDGDVITPSNMNANEPTNYGSYTNSALASPYSVLYVQKSGYKIRELAYDFASDSFVSGDITLFSEHLFTNPVKQVVYLGEPYQTVVVLFEDGRLCCMAYQKEHDIMAWYCLSVSGAIATSIAVIHGSAGDELYCEFDRSGNITIERLVNS